jgi:short-subunit dehydrogenase
MAGIRDWRDRVAVVTGASSGIGAELARQLAARGVRTALVARRRGRLEALAGEIAASGGRASVHVCDVGCAADVERSAAEIERALGPPSILVNNAGLAVHALFEDHSAEEVERMVRINLLGTIHWIRAVLPGMRAGGEGWIVNVSSFAGKVAQPDESVYSATKFAVAALSDALRWELREAGISVLAVYPGLVRTEMFGEEVLRRLPKAARSQFIEPSECVGQVLRALERGRRELFVPRRYAWLYRVRTLLPGMMGPIFAKVKLGAVSERTRPPSD